MTSVAGYRSAVQHIEKGTTTDGISTVRYLSLVVGGWNDERATHPHGSIEQWSELDL